MRPAEPAHVAGVEYTIARDLTTWMRLRLVIIDDSSPLHKREFTVDLPPPQTGYADFVILRSRWEAAMQQRCRAGDDCQVCAFQESKKKQWMLGCPKRGQKMKFK